MSEESAVKKKVRGRPFPKGQSGHPEGRKPIPDEVKKMLATFAPEAVQFQYDTMKSPEAPWPVRVRCAELLADRGLGKPVQSVNVEGGGSMIIVLKDDVEGV